MFSSPVPPSPTRRISTPTTPNGTAALSTSPASSNRRRSSGGGSSLMDGAHVDMSSAALTNALFAAFEQYSSLSRSTGPGLDSMRFRKLCIVSISAFN